MWDLRAKQYFKSKEDYHRGTELLRKYLAACSRFKSFNEISANFLDLLDDETDHESDLLEKAANLHASRQIDTGKDPYLTQLKNDDLDASGCKQSNRLKHINCITTKTVKF